MKIAVLSLLSILIISIILFIIFYNKKIDLARKITQSLQIPLIAAATICSITAYLPDSIHIILISSFAYAFCTACTVLMHFKEKIICRVLGRLFYLLSIFCWFILFKSTFYIYKVSAPVFLISSAIYLAIFITLCISLGKQTFEHYFWTFLSIFTCSLLHFSSVITLINGHELYSYLLALGTSGMYAQVIYYLIEYKKPHGLNGVLIENIILICPQMLISASCYLMIS